MAGKGTNLRISPEYRKLIAAWVAVTHQPAGELFHKFIVQHAVDVVVGAVKNGAIVEGEAGFGVTPGWAQAPHIETAVALTQALEELLKKCPDYAYKLMRGELGS